MIDEKIRTKKINFTLIAKISFYVITIILMIFSWPITSQLKMQHLHPIASTVATISGMLFGFVMGTMSFLTTSNDLTLVKNTTKTKYLPKLISRLHSTMGWLLAVCGIFLVSMFIPDTLTFEIKWLDRTYLFSSVIAQFGVLILIISFKEFLLTWREFKRFITNI